MGKRKDFVQSETLKTALVLLGTGNPLNVVYSPKGGVFFWDTAGSDLYFSDELGKTSWALLASGGGPSSTFTLDQFDVSIYNQVSFTLSSPPLTPSKVIMVINGHWMRNGVHFTVAGSIVTFIPASAGFVLELTNEFGVPDRVEFEYFA